MNYVQSTTRRNRDMNRRGFYYPNRMNGTPYIRADMQMYRIAGEKYLNTFPCKQCCGVKSVWDFSVRWQGAIVPCPTCKGTGHTRKAYKRRASVSRRPAREAVTAAEYKQLLQSGTVGAICAPPIFV